MGFYQSKNPASSLAPRRELRTLTHPINALVGHGLCICKSSTSRGKGIPVFKRIGLTWQGLEHTPPSLCTSSPSCKSSSVKALTIVTGCGRATLLNAKQQRTSEVKEEEDKDGRGQATVKESVVEDERRKSTKSSYDIIAELFFSETFPLLCLLDCD